MDSKGSAYMADQEYLQDESIESYETHEYEPIAGANLNNPGEIRIYI